MLTCDLGRRRHRAERSVQVRVQRDGQHRIAEEQVHNLVAVLPEHEHVVVQLARANVRFEDARAAFAERRAEVAHGRVDLREGEVWVRWEWKMGGGGDG